MIKERRTDTHVYFVNGTLSQWYASPFEANVLFGDLGCHRFNCCEQYMMANKALLFDDMDVFYAIMNETNPKVQKELGRKVRGFDINVWNKHAKDIVFNGNVAKFSTEELKPYLIGTGELYLVEGAWYDPVWGVGLAWDDPRIEDPANWKGTNWLGETLMKVRKELMES